MRVGVEPKRSQSRGTPRPCPICRGFLVYRGEHYRPVGLARPVRPGLQRRGVGGADGTKRAMELLVMLELKALPEVGRHE